jgi:SAM-dependent methyltransferase
VEAARTASGFREVQYVEFGYDKLLEAMEARGVKPTELLLSADGFRAYLEAARYQDYHPDYYKETPDYLAQKQVQHYLSTVITPVEGKPIWMDVASSTSPFAEILTRLYGIKVYRQDLSYPPGVEGLRVGSDASAIPLPDGAVGRVSLHCSFEHFEGNADSEFMRELGRILRPGGSAAIIPLYVSNTYRILTNPYYWLKRGVPREAGCQVTVSRDYWENHGRFYDWEALERRVLRPRKGAGLSYEFIRVTVPPGIDYPPFLVLKIVKPLGA